MAESVRAHHPGAQVLVLVVDGAQHAGTDEPFTPLSPADLGVDAREVARRAALYTPQELISSLKPLLMRHLVTRHGTPAVLLDADCLVLGDLAALTEPATRHAVVLTPHRSVPAAHTPGGYGPEQDFLRSGVFNGGVLACGPGSAPFLDWWAPRTARDSIVDADQALTMSQSWLALVPALFDHHVVRDRGINVMGHNLDGDDLRWPADGPPTVAGTPVRLHHFAGGFDARHPLALYGGPRRYPWWPDAAQRPGLARLCEEYAALLLAAGHEEAHGRPSAFGSAGPVPLDAPMRRAYRAALVAAERTGGDEPPAPLADGPDAFLAWMATPAEPGSPASRWLTALRDLRPDLQAAFPAGSGDGALVEWAASKGPPGPHGLPLAAASA